jgi:hypothetical protein
MDLWLTEESRLRRDDALKSARSSRLARSAARGRSGFRMRAAKAAEAMSDALAALARSLRNGEAA